MLALAIGLAFPGEPLAAQSNEFVVLTQHVERKVGEEKRRFGIASACTEWFYKRHQHKPPPSPVEPIRWQRRVAGPSGSNPDFSLAGDCPRLYPNGLEDARQAFSSSQAALSLGLTFYEFALVADGDDDRIYSSAELADLLDAMILPSVAAQLDTGAVLKSTFDTWLTDRNLEQIMNGMNRLYDQGYRLTQSDRAELDRVMQ